MRHSYHHHHFVVRVSLTLAFLCFISISQTWAQHRINIDSIARAINTQFGDCSRSIPLTTKELVLDDTPILPSSLRIVRCTLPANQQPKLLLDSTATHLYIDAPFATERDTLWIEYRKLPRKTSEQFSIYELLDSVSPSEKPRWKQIQEQQTSSTPSAQWLAPLTLKGYAEREATIGESVQAPFAGRMHLELEGVLESNLRIQGELSDQSLPFQPDGTTTQISALDRIYLGVSDSLWKVEAGDITIGSANHFLHFQTPIQGLRYQYQSLYKHRDSLLFDLAAGITKGEYAEIALQGIEAIQGPYRIYPNATYLQVAAIAGSEHVYLNGILLSRGYDKDYTIDYNLGEIYFTIRQPIHASSRILVKYEKASKLYTRYLFHSKAKARLHNGWLLDVQSYIAHDDRSSLALTENKTEALEQLSRLPSSDSLLQYIAPPEQIDGRKRSGYLLVDTLIDKRSYSIFRYVEAGKYDSVYNPYFHYNPSSGNYIQMQAANNELIYVWQAPQNGKSIGNYSIGQQLKPPSTHQLVQATLGYNTSASRTQVTFALSHQNSNTLNLSQKQHTGVAAELYHENRLFSLGSLTLWVGGESRIVLKDFRPAQNFLDFNFLRNWGLEHGLAAINWGDGALWFALKHKMGHSQLGAKTFVTQQHKGLALELQQQYRWQNIYYKTNISARQLRTDSLRRWTGQLTSELAYQWQKWRPALFIEGELQHSKQDNTIKSNDYRWFRTGAKLHSSDSALYSFASEHTYRYDAATLLPTLQPERQTLEQTLQSTLNLQHWGTYSAHINYQYQSALHLHTKTRSTTNTLLTQISSALAFWKERIRCRLVQELSTEQTPEWQQRFIRVPDGQGQYRWIDANGDGQQQLEEFVPAAFRDQGQYVLQLTPTNKTHTTKSSKYQLSLNISARERLQAIDSSTVWWQRWDLEVNAQTEQKLENAPLYKSLLPIHWQPHTEGLRQSFHTTLWLNKDHAPLTYFLSATYNQQIQNLSQGKNTLLDLQYRGGVQSPHSTPWISILEGEWQIKQLDAPYNKTTKLEARLWKLHATLGWRTSSSGEHRLIFQHSWLTLLAHRSTPARILELEYSLTFPIVKEWKGEGQLTYARTKLQILSNNPLAYSLTQGYLDGNNFIGNISLRWQLSSNIAIVGSYELRSLGTAPFQQAGNLAIRSQF